MRLMLPTEQAQKLKIALKHAGTREIGGQLFGEQQAPSDFRITKLTIQRHQGSFARFLVDIVQAAQDAATFFSQTSHSYRRFNYIGEWHSHPSFAVQPSETDIRTMRMLVKDSEFRGNFAVLIIVRLDGDTLNKGAWLFDPAGNELAISLEIS